MITQLKEIRERLQDAVNTKDWWVVKSQMNKLDTIIYSKVLKTYKCTRCGAIIESDTPPNNVCTMPNNSGTSGICRGQFVII